MTMTWAASPQLPPTNPRQEVWASFQISKRKIVSGFMVMMPVSTSCVRMGGRAGLFSWLVSCVHFLRNSMAGGVEIKHSPKWEHQLNQWGAWSSYVTLTEMVTVLIKSPAVWQAPTMISYNSPQSLVSPPRPQWVLWCHSFIMSKDFCQSLMA